MIVKHHSDVEWDGNRWPNFTPPELACRCCGEFYWDPPSFDFIQAVRTKLGKPVHIYSGHRCWRHNANVGGAPNSLHKKIAFDIALNGDPKAVLQAALACGANGLGFYKTFLHADLGRVRRWTGKGWERTWAGLT